MVQTVGSIQYDPLILWARQGVRHAAYDWDIDWNPSRQRKGDVRRDKRFCDLSSTSFTEHHEDTGTGKRGGQHRLAQKLCRYCQDHNERGTGLRRGNM
eukprot:377339-Hanusia_phi.AAC.3